MYHCGHVICRLGFSSSAGYLVSCLHWSVTVDGQSISFSFWQASGCCGTLALHLSWDFVLFGRYHWMA
ncbi:hypothetical protein XENTR_v10005961 [Xenopus tropicalis]|nr:hypothetical protein XENTR_v10005961 [Xenopus tropicalis]